jgi:hypothetical protein
VADEPGGDARTLSGYDPSTTDLLLGITADVLRSFGSTFGGHVAIIGGLVPTLLVPEPPADMEDHVGTADIDLCLSLHLIDGETSDYYASIVEGLARMGLEHGERDGRTTRWRWVGAYRGVRLVVDLLSPSRSTAGRPERPREGSVAERNVGDASGVATIALAHGHLVALDTDTITRRVPAAAGNLDFDFPVAGLTAWLCLKVDGIRSRDKAKDAFDVVWVLQAVGPEAAAAIVHRSRLLASDLADETRAQIDRLIDDQFLDVDSVGPGQYAAFREAPDDDRLKRDAHATVQAFGAALRGDR